MRLSKLLIVLALFLLAGCSKTTFNAYEHSAQLMTITSREEFDRHQDYLLSHTSEHLQQTIIAEFRNTISDPAFQINRIRAFADNNKKNNSKVILEYQCTTSFSQYILTGYFEYKDDYLIRYKIYRNTIDTY